MSSCKAIKFFGLVVILAAILVDVPLVSSKSVNKEEDDLLATSLFLKQSFPKETLMAAAILAQEESAIDNLNSNVNYDDNLDISELLASGGRSLQGESINDYDNGQPKISISPVSAVSAIPQSSPKPINHLQKLTTPLTKMIQKHSQRSKRSIGFLTRLGACVMTFMSNPSCWSRLTRVQIQREQKRQLELQQQQMEQQKKFLEQQIYEGYVNTLLYNSNNGSLNGTLTEDGKINGTALALAMTQNIPVPTLPPFGTTARPRLFPWISRFRLFPRLMSVMENMTGLGGSSGSGSINSDSIDGGRSSGYFMSPSNSRQPQFRNLF